MGCTYEFQGKLYTEEQMNLLMQTKGFQNKVKIMREQESYSPFSIIDDDFSFDEEAETVVDLKANLEKIKEYKLSLVRLYRNRISNLKLLINNENTDTDTAKKYSKLQTKLETRIEDLQKEITDLNKENPLTLSELRYQALVDFERVNQLLNTGTLGDDPLLNKEIFENAEEAKRIINFYKAMEITQSNVTVDGTPIVEHPLFNHNEIYNPVTGKADVLPEEIQQVLNQIALDFKKHENQLNNLYKDVVTNVINSNPHIKKMYGELTYDEITKAIPDANIIDMFIMDITKGIFSNNGVLPQVVMDAFQGNWAEHISKYKKFEERHNTLLAKAEKVLKKLKQTLVGFTGAASFDMFFQKSFTGRNTGNLVERYSTTFSELRDSFMTQYDQEIERALFRDDVGQREKALLKAFDKKKTWFRENTIVLDPRKIPEIQAMFPEFADLFVTDDTHVEEIKENISEIGYNEVLAEQIKNVKNFVKWKEIYIETYLEQRGVDNISDLEAVDQSQLEMDIMMQNPFLTAENINKTDFISHNGLVINPTYKYSTYVPRKYKLKTNRKASVGADEYVMTNSTEPTNFYDESFKIIENHPELKDYYDLVYNEMSSIMDQFPEEIKSKLFSNSLPSIQKAIAEIYADPNIGFIKKLIKMASAIYESIKMGFGINLEDSIHFDNVDVITNQRDPRVNAQFINDNRAEVEKRATVERIKFAKLHGKKITTKSSIPYADLNAKTLQYLTNLLGVKEPLDLKRRFGDSIPVGSIIEKAILANIVENKSVNLPKIIKYYSKMAHEYSARQEMLPYINILKNHYGKIGKSVKTSLGEAVKLNGRVETRGLRNKAVSQFESWFERQVLGNEGDKHFWVNNRPLLERKTMSDKLRALVSGRILSFEDQKLKKDLDKLINEEKNEVTRKELIDMRESLGKKAAFSKVLSNLLSHITFVSLGYSIKSGITNFIEGQTANMITASTGDYFESKHYYRAMHIVTGSFLKSAYGNLGKLTPKGAKKTRVLADRFDILQDASNELQKANIKTPFSRFEKFQPMELTKRIEYVNQTPLMIAIMLNTPITGDGGKTTNVWDAMDVNGKLLPQYRTPANIETWEDGQGDAYKEFRNKVNQAIVTTHGNYDKLRGMMLKSNVLGKALIMFKTWISSAIYGRFAFEHDDLITEQKKVKGRYWSNTRSSGIIHGALSGLTMAGIPGAIVGGVAGFTIASFGGVRSNLGIGAELVFTAKALLRKFIGIPINILSGRELISDSAGYDKLLKEGKFTQRDLRNMKGIMADLSMILGWLSFTVLSHALLWDDDDEEDSTKRLAHNLLVNQGMQLSSASLMYVNPMDLFKNVVASNGPLTFLGDVTKFFDAVGKWQKNQISGKTLGEKAAKITLPSLLRDSYLGFNKNAERVYKAPIFDEIAWDEERILRKEITVKREVYREELRNLPENEKLTEKQITKLVNTRYKMPKDIKDTSSKTAKKSAKVVPKTIEERKEASASYKKQIQKVIKEKKAKQALIEQQQDDEVDND